ncbi:DUF3995 domain-containing protein [Natrononativus amylolyticus]|uniref:DUF3995 domain-containing protein n=1 Tax=Natrononativus amylolyticus TaxID=2963434 RepID=UPI0020CF570D|nr:DUF3995 domain-containing protein [Natrononativus amylolyticus]
MSTTSYRPYSSRARAAAVSGYAAAAWALLFGAAHVYWAVGGTLGLQGNAMTGVLLAINLIAIPLCFLAAIVALALVRSWGVVVPRRLWHAAAWGAGGVLALRGVVGLAQTVLSQEPTPLLLAAYDSWFLLGGALFFALAASSRRTERTPADFR